eukprot:s134_g10.t1
MNSNSDDDKWCLLTVMAKTAKPIALVKDVGEVKVENPFLSLPNPTQNNPCKLLVHKDASHKLIQPASTMKKHIVSAIKAQLVEICKLTYAKPNARVYYQQTLKRCAALHLGTDEGRMAALSTAVQDDDPDKELEQDEEHAAAHDEEEELMKPAVEAVAALQDSVSSAVTTYGCLALEGSDLDKGIAVKTSDHVLFHGFRRYSRVAGGGLLVHSVKGFVSNMKGGVMGRLAKKLAGYTHGACLPFSDCPKWLKLLRHMANPEEVEGEHLLSKGLMELKGIEGTRVAAIDLTKLPLAGQRRQVHLVHDGAALALWIQNDLGDEAVEKVSLAQDTKYAEVSSPWSELEDVIKTRIEECTVEKIGVFNMGLKRTAKLNSFQISERFPWKTVFLSSISIQIFTANAHGTHYGYDLHGDPEDRFREMERPCKWMQAALAKGYEPRNYLFMASKIEFENLGTSVPLPRRLWQGDNRSLLWADKEGKFPLPEWVRGMRKMTDLNPDKWPAWMFHFNDGRNLDHYIAKMNYDDSSPILAALETLGWKPDPLVRMHVEEKKHFWNSEKPQYTEQAEGVQISGKLVTAVYPYTKEMAGMQTLPFDMLRHSGESTLTSVYELRQHSDAGFLWDYTESYVESCFVLEALSLPSADDVDDGWTEMGGRMSASMTFCTNNFQSPKRDAVPVSSAVDRKDVMQAMIDYFSKSRPDNMKVAARSMKSCSSEADCSGNTCMGPSDCKENAASPCPVGFGCACDTSKNQALFAASLGASLLCEVVQNSIILGPGWIAGCTALAVGSLGGLAPLSDVILAFVFASVVGGLNTCGCVPLKCESSSTFSNSVCALKHPQAEDDFKLHLDEEMLNPYHFVPPPKQKCVPSFFGCSMDSCNASDMMDGKVGWHVETRKHYWHAVGIHNCKYGEFNASDTETFFARSENFSAAFEGLYRGLTGELVKSFDYQQFADEHKDLSDVQTSLVPQYQAPPKLKALPKDLIKCVEAGNSTVATVAKRTFAPVCAVWSVGKASLRFVLELLEKLVSFAIDVVINALKIVRAVIFGLFGLIHKHLLGKRVWREECEAVDFAIPTPDEVQAVLAGNATSNAGDDTSAAPSSMFELESGLFGPGSLCMSGGHFRPCEEMDLRELNQLYHTTWADVLDESLHFYKELAGVDEPEKKRKIIGRLFVEAFEKAVTEMGLPHDKCLLLQGTLYPDVIESTSYKGPSSVIKTHHNVGGLPDRMKMEVIEPLRLLFKDEVRALGNELGLPVTSVMRHPFPGPGLGIRIIGEVTKDSAETLSLADDIYIEELRKTGHYDKIGQAFAVLLPTVRSVGVMGDHRTYENVCVLRAVTTTDFMTADWYDMPHDVLARISNRIINEVKGINRVCYDVSSKPPATIEWE